MELSLKWNIKRKEDVVMEVGCMTMIKESNIPELVEDMKEYSTKIKSMDPDKVKETLIRIGVLDKKGIPKEQICGERYYAG